jgi:hypothetical protein
MVRRGSEQVDDESEQWLAFFKDEVVAVTL